MASSMTIIIQTVLAVNIFLAVTWLIFIFNLLISEWMPVELDTEPTLWWPIGIVFSIVAFAVINIQITMDIILFKCLLWSDMEFSRNLLFRNIDHCEKTIETHQQWLKMTTAFEVFQILAFSLSLFYDDGLSEFQRNPYYLLTIGLGGIVLRGLGLYLINAHEAELNCLMPPSFQRGHVVFISLSPEFYRSQSQHSVNSVVRFNA